MISDEEETSFSHASGCIIGDSLLVLRFFFLMSCYVSRFVSSSKIIVLLGRGASSMFLTIENMCEVLVVLTEEDLE